MIIIKKYLAALLIVFTSSIAYANESTVPGESNGTVWDIEISNINSLELDKGFDMSAVKSGPYLLNQDPMCSMVGKFFGSDKFFQFVKDLGCTKQYQQDPLIASMFYFVLWILGALATGSVLWLCWLVFKAQTIENESKFTALLHGAGAMKAWLAIVVFLFIKVGSILMPNNLLFAASMLNWAGLSFTLHTTEFKTTPVLEDASLQKNYYATAGLVNIDTSAFKTKRQALFAFNSGNMADAGLVGSYSKQEVAEKILGMAEPKIDTNALSDINIDATMNFRNAFNFYVTANNYTVKNDAPFLKMWERKTWSYGTNFGVINFNNALGLNFEKNNGASINDGTLIVELRDMQKGAAKSLGNETLNFIEKIDSDEGFFQKIKDGAVDSTDVYNEAYLKKFGDEIVSKYKADAQALAKQFYKPEELGIKDPALHLAALAAIYKAAYSGYLGADMNAWGNGGELLSKLMSQYVRRITIAKMNEICTIEWKDNEPVRASVAAYNSIPGDTKFKDIVKGSDGMSLPLSNQCIYLADDGTFKNFGSANIEDALTFKTKQMQMSYAINFVFNKIQEGMRSAILEDKSASSYYQAELIRNMQNGVLGASSNITLAVHINQQKKAAFNSISNTLFVQYNGELKETNYVNEEAFTGSKDKEVNSQIHQMSASIYPVISYRSLHASPIVNIQPSTDENESAIEALVTMSAQQTIDKIFGTDNTALKLMIGLPLNMSVSEGAAFCRRDMNRCSTNEKVNIFTGLVMMGAEFTSDALTTIAIKTTLGVILERWDGGVNTDALSAAEKTAAASVGDASRIGTFAKIAANLGAAIAHVMLIALYIVASAQMTIAWFKLALGFIAVVVMPASFMLLLLKHMLIQVTDILSILIKLVVSVFVAMFESEASGVWRNVANIILETIFATLRPAFYFILMCVSVAILTNIDLSSSMMMLISMTAGKGLIANTAMTVMVIAVYATVAYTLIRFADQKHDELAKIFSVHAERDESTAFLMQQLQNAAMLNAMRDFSAMSESEIKDFARKAKRSSSNSKRDYEKARRTQAVQAARSKFRSHFDK